MKIKEIKISKNRRLVNDESVTELVSSIREVGLLNPIIIDEKNRLIAGMHRLQALKSLGFDKLKKNQYRIVSLKSIKAELAEIDENLVRCQLDWKEEALVLSRRKEIYEELYPETKRGGDRTKAKSCQSEIVSFCKDTADKMGLSERTVRQKVEIAKIISEHDELKDCSSASQARFKYKKIQHEKKCKADLKKNTSVKEEVFHGDCLKGIPKLKDNSVSCLLSDPPYGINYKTERYGEKHTILNDDCKAFPLLDDMLRAIKPKLKKEASVYIFCSWKNLRQFMDITEKYYSIKNLLVWVKSNHGVGDLTSWAERHELCIYATLGKHQTIGARPHNVLEFDRTNEYHPCEKPVPMLSYIIEKSTVAGELVVDPFAGSGSTGVACKKTGRKFKLMEMENKNIKIIEQRLKHVC